MTEDLGIIACRAMDKAWSLPAYKYWQAVADAVVAAHEARRWRSIETAPKHLYVDVIAAGRRIPNAKQSPTMTGGDNWRWWSNGAMILEDVTHWTPIPAPPKEADHGK